VPGTQQWFDYWSARVDKLLAEEELGEKISLAFFDALIAGTATVQHMDQEK
jgi:hypothetical protein